MVDVNLLKAADLCAKGWCQGAYARDENGKPCDISQGVSFCQGGARIKTYREGDRQKFVLLPDDFPFGHNVALVWNDDPKRTQDEVVDMLIAAAFWGDDLSPVRFYGPADLKGPNRAELLSLGISETGWYWHDEAYFVHGPYDDPESCQEALDVHKAYATGNAVLVNSIPRPDSNSM